MKRINLIGFALLVWLSPAAQAQTGNCFLSTFDLNFGLYSPFSEEDLEVNGQLNVDCRPPHWAQVPHPVIYQVSSSAGLNSGNDFLQRKLLSAADGGLLSYNLYRDSARTEILGDGTGSTVVFESQGDAQEHHHELPPQADCHAHTEGVQEDHELGECHAHVSPKFVRKYHLRVQGEKHEHPTGTLHHHDFVTTLIIYARIPARQTSVTAGTYTDIITVTILF